MYARRVCVQTFASGSRAYRSVKKQVKPVPRTPSQMEFVNVLRNQEDPYVIIATGPAGCGKTMLSTHVGMEKLLNKEVERIVITRPAVSVDENHGFLPGKLEDKLMPWMRPILDAMTKVVSQADVERMIKNKTLELSPLAYMRGRTFEKAWIICDEAQNCTPSQVLMILTRMGVGSKLIITGDPMQHDRGFEENGLTDLMRRCYERDDEHPNSHWIYHHEFDDTDVVRHPVIPYILKMYEKP